jgi:hypothetical protein
MRTFSSSTGSDFSPPNGPVTVARTIGICSATIGSSVKTLRAMTTTAHLYQEFGMPLMASA